MLTDNLKKSVRDLRFLLNKGYPKDSAVEFVSDHYLLDSEKRHFLIRSVYPKEKISTHESKLIDISEIRDRKVKIDGYNVLITTESILRGDLTIRCDDGALRDLQANFGSYQIDDYTEESVKTVLNILEGFCPQKITFCFDKQVSKSGELAGFVREELSKRGILGDAEAIGGVDKEVWNSEVAASSDSLIIEKAERVIDIPKEFLKTDNTEFVDLKEI